VIPAVHGDGECGCRGKGCPITCALLEELRSVPGVKLTGAMFSVLLPGAHLRPHCGPHNGRLKLHLALIVPESAPPRAPWMRIGVPGEVRGWRQGKCNFLDDSFEHEVVNAANATRVVLEVIMKHPQLAEVD